MYKFIRKNFRNRFDVIQPSGSGNVVANRTTLPQQINQRDINPSVDNDTVLSQKINRVLGNFAKLEPQGVGIYSALRKLIETPEFFSAPETGSLSSEDINRWKQSSPMVEMYQELRNASKAANLEKDFDSVSDHQEMVVFIKKNREALMEKGSSHMGSFATKAAEIGLNFGYDMVSRSGPKSFWSAFGIEFLENLDNQSNSQKNSEIKSIFINSFDVGKKKSKKRQLENPQSLSGSQDVSRQRAALNPELTLGTSDPSELPIL